jgi:hypothetical protein
VLALAPEAVAADLPLLTTRAALTLEGLEFHRDAGGKPGATSLSHIQSQRASLAVANCLCLTRGHGLTFAIQEEVPTASMAPIRFQKDLSPKTAPAEKPSPGDFRVHESGDKGPGADVDLVGPGPAYERWRKTPAYQEWLKDTGQGK